MDKVFETVNCGSYYENVVNGSTSIEECFKFIRSNLYEWGDVPVLWNLTNLNLKGTNYLELRSHITSNHEIWRSRKNTRNAIIAPRDTVFGIARIIVSIVNCNFRDVDLKVHKNRAEAETWLFQLKKSRFPN